MKYNDNSATAAEYLKQAIPLMVEKKIPTNPINYTLWYNYVANHIPLLTRALENIANSSDTLTPEESYDLFFQYILQDELKEQNQALSSISGIASHMLHRLSESVQGSEVFGQQLESDIKQLEQASSLQDVNEIIELVITTTRNIRDSNEDFKDSLQKANAEIDTLKGQLQDAERQIYTDQLTQVNNRYAFDRKMSDLIVSERAESLFLILLDLDHFKSVNDNYGHVVGDKVLQSMGLLLGSYCNSDIFAARYGGEEFAILLQNATPQTAGELADSIRKNVMQISVTLNDSGAVLENLTASFGVARYIKHEPEGDFIQRADNALYRAKNKGRNRVEI